MRCKTHHLFGTAAIKRRANIHFGLEDETEFGYLGVDQTRQYLGGLKIKRLSFIFNK